MPATITDKQALFIRTWQCPATESEKEEEDSDSEIFSSLTFPSFHTPEPDVNVTHLLQNPPCGIILSIGPNMSNELDVLSAPVPPILQHVSFLPGTEISFPELSRTSVLQNLPKTVNLPEQIFKTDKTECDLPKNVCLLERGSLLVDVNDIQDEQHPVSSDGSESNKEMDDAGSG